MGQVAYLPDPTFNFIKMLEFLKLASKLKVPTEKDLLARAKKLNLPSVALSITVETVANS